MRHSLLVLLLASVTLAGCATEKAQAPTAKRKAPAADLHSQQEAEQARLQRWLDEHQPRLQAAVKDSAFEVRREAHVLIVTAPADSTFNPDRPHMLVPASLAPLTRLAKELEKDPEAAVLILGHADSSGNAKHNDELSGQRAQAVASIFRLTGFQRDRLSLKGLGSLMPRAANDSLAGRKLNRRVEMIVTPRHTLEERLAYFSQAQPAAPQLASADLPAKRASKANAKAKSKTTSQP